MTCCVVVPGISFRVGLHLPWVDGVSVLCFLPVEFCARSKRWGGGWGKRLFTSLPSFWERFMDHKMLEYLYLPASMLLNFRY
ncbi:hypothetical protein I7I50_12415 [Histoplasma capsulatum G186AR]|uniref:Uncharacterized protein n=1 Tax=Ajellomyces capsulatus TaxID=5037 RepID=A0A8H8CRU1_AJECA|nr:hypothetical protein I7I52_11278 [Histoplasma capsulatum]QSS70692.1 hypothetical protein I7I50_12415 [Histoplasma capsulatum G186AR]